MILSEVQKMQIKELLKQAMSHHKIADILRLSYTDVSRYVKELMNDNWAPRDDMNVREITTEEFICEWCGKIGWKNDIGRMQRFCCDRCRRVYWRYHRSTDRYTKVCGYCGEQFYTNSAKAKFCSHNCYMKNRFWTKEDAEKTVNALMDGEDIVLPNWLKEKLQEQLK